MKNIVLIGMPGCGKSTFGKVLAQELELTFYDADDVLEQRENRTIKDFFAESEEAFRDAETRTLSYLAALENAVIATGGGCVKRKQNMELLQKTGSIVFLHRLPENIVNCISGDSRPLLAQNKERVFQLYSERIDLYRKYAEYTVENNGDYQAALLQLKQCAEEIRK